MYKTLNSLIVIGISLIYSQKAFAIVFIPPLLLIPIAKLVAIILGGLALPTIGIGAILNKGNSKAILKTLLLILCVLLLLGIIVAIALRIQNPARPWF